MKAWLVSTRPTESAGIWSAPGMTYCTDRSRSGAYIGCGNDGAAMISRIGSAGCQFRPGALPDQDGIRAGRDRRVEPVSDGLLQLVTSSAAASGGSGADAGPGRGQRSQGLRNRAAVGGVGPAGAAGRSPGGRPRFPAAVITKSGCCGPGDGVRGDAGLIRDRPDRRGGRRCRCRDGERQPAWVSGRLQRDREPATASRGSAARAGHDPLDRHQAAGRGRRRARSRPVRVDPASSASRDAGRTGQGGLPAAGSGWPGG